MKKYLVKGLLVSACAISILSSASASTCTTLTKGLAKGGENSEVLALQQFLFDSGYLTAKPNGYYGAGTVTAVKKFQKANGLPQAGSVGAGTREKVKEVSCGSVQAKSNVVPVFPVITSNPGASLLNGKSLEFMEIGKVDDGLTSADDPLEIDGKFAYTVKKQLAGTTEIHYFYNGSEIGKGYDRIGSPKELYGKLTYNATKDNKNFMVYDGKEYNEDSPVLTEVNGKVAYVIHKDSKAFLTYDGKEYGKEYDYVLSAANINSKLAYVAGKRISVSNPDVSSIVFFDDKKIGEYFKIGGFYNTPDLLNINGKLTYVVKTKDNQNYIVYGDTQTEKGYTIISAPSGVLGKLAYDVKKDDKNFIIYDGKEIGKEYDSAQKIIDVGGKLVYGVTKGTKSFLIYDGKEIGKEYDRVTQFINVNGKLAYLARKGSTSLVVYDGKEIGKEYGFVSKIVSVKGKLAFVVTKGVFESFIVIEK